MVRWDPQWTSYEAISCYMFIPAIFYALYSYTQRRRMDAQQRFRAMLDLVPEYIPRTMTYFSFIIVICFVCRASWFFFRFTDLLDSRPVEGRPSCRAGIRCGQQILESAVNRFGYLLFFAAFSLIVTYWHKWAVTCQALIQAAGGRNGGELDAVSAKKALESVPRRDCVDLSFFLLSVWQVIIQGFILAVFLIVDDKESADNVHRLYLIQVGVLYALLAASLLYNGCIVRQGLDQQLGGLRSWKERAEATGREEGNQQRQGPGLSTPLELAAVLQGRLPPSQRDGGGGEIFSRTLEALTSGVTSGVGALGRVIGLGGAGDNGGRGHGRARAEGSDLAAAVMGARHTPVRGVGGGGKGRGSAEHRRPLLGSADGGVTSVPGPGSAAASGKGIELRAVRRAEATAGGEQRGRAAAAEYDDDAYPSSTQGAAMTGPELPVPRLGTAAAGASPGGSPAGAPAKGTPGHSRVGAGSYLDGGTRVSGRRALAGEIGRMGRRAGAGSAAGTGFGSPFGPGGGPLGGLGGHRGSVAGSLRGASFASVSSVSARGGGGQLGAAASPWSDPLFGLEREMERAADTVASDRGSNREDGAGGAVALLSTMVQSVQAGVAGALGSGADGEGDDDDALGWFEDEEDQDRGGGGEGGKTPTMRRVDRLLVLLEAAMARVGAIMVACTFLFALRAVLFALGPIGNLRLEGLWGQAFYPWFFYTLPELVCGCLVLLVTAPHGEAHKGNGCAGCLEGVGDVAGCVSCGFVCCCFCCCCPECRPESLSAQTEGPMADATRRRRGRGRKAALPTVRQLEMQGGRFAMRHGREVVERFTKGGIPLAMGDRDVGSEEDEAEAEFYGGGYGRVAGQ